jgi:aspartate-semialdehyde dehydrogenase
METIAVVGATGAVGAQIVRLLEERAFPIKQLRLFASCRSIGKTVAFRGENIPLECLSERHLKEGFSLAFFAAGSTVSKEWIPKAVAANILCIDSSSAFRMDKEVPLVIPEINPEALLRHRGVIASPNCAATILLLPLAPLHRLFGAKRVVLSTYQAASGGGAMLLSHLEEETRAVLANTSFETSFPFPYAFNLYPHNSMLHPSGYVEEEIKILEESRKILNHPSLALSATCVRVPVLRAHSLAANVEFVRPFTLPDVYKAVEGMAGLRLFESRGENRFPTPADATGLSEVLCGRFRIDKSQPKTLEFWAVGDQLLKGAALNAVQIAERMRRDATVV